MPNDMNEHWQLSFEQEEKLWREFWINKLGYYPTKIEKVVSKVSFKEFNKEKEDLEIEFKQFVNSKK